jgi:diaminobutyrate-2-oxoglutarate transaminase
MQGLGDVIVQRFSSSQLADVTSMRSAARMVAEALAAGRRCAVVVCPLPRTASELSGLVEAIGPDVSARELAQLAACGAALSGPLFAMCLHSLGVRAASVQSADLGTLGGASLDVRRLRGLLDERVVPVVAALSGDSQLGAVECAADLTAVTLAAALSASWLELYADGTASGLGARLDYDALLRHGASLRPDEAAVALAKQLRVPLRLVGVEEPARATLVKHASLVPPALAEPPARSNTAVFEARESNVRGYCRSFPTVFARAKGALQWDESGRRYVDFFSGAGALNYGHNPDAIKRRLLDYLESDGVSHALDMYTQAKRTFLETFRDVVLEPRGLDYKVQFCGPTGANSVEAALKLARLNKGRSQVASFTGGWHGMTAACLSVCGNRENREAAGVPLPFTTIFPFPEGPYKPADSLGQLEWLFADPNSGLDKPAAIILETLQSEGGIYAAPVDWLRGLRALCDRHDVLLIADDIQVGCGRTGSFFSFERAGIVPDMVCLSKSIGGYGQPMSLLLMRPELDTWKPGQHTGTFRGNQLAFVAATAALEFWRDPEFVAGIAERSGRLRSFLVEQVAPLHPALEVRGVGMMWGIDLSGVGGPDLAKAVGNACFKEGLIIERCGRDDTVLKLMAPLNIALPELEEGLAILGNALKRAIGERAATALSRVSA